jgi:Flp pilus assembly protein TadG
MRHRLTMPLLLVLMLFLPLGLATADDDAVARAKDEAARQAAESAELRKVLSQMAAERQQMRATLTELDKRVALLTDELMATKARLMELERKLAAVGVDHAGLRPAETTPAAPSLAAPTSAANPAALVGSYSLDKEHLRKALLEMALKQVETMIDQIPEESRASILEMVKTQIDMQADKFRITLTLSADGTYTAAGRLGTQALDASGTWQAQGKSLTLTKTMESGANLPTPEKQRATIDGEAILIGLEESPDFTVRMVRE